MGKLVKAQFCYWLYLQITECSFSLFLPIVPYLFQSPVLLWMHRNGPIARWPGRIRILESETLSTSQVIFPATVAPRRVQSGLYCIRRFYSPRPPPFLGEVSQSCHFTWAGQSPLWQDWCATVANWCLHQGPLLWLHATTGPNDIFYIYTHSHHFIRYL